MSLPVVSAIASGVSSLAGLVGGMYAADKSSQAGRDTNAANLQIARETNQANLDLYREQYKNSVEQWQREAEYNSPQNKVSMLRLAGLNPAMAYGETGNQGSASLPSASPAVTGAPMVNPMNQYSDIMANAFRNFTSDLVNTMQGIEALKSQGMDNQIKAATMQDSIAKSMLEIAQKRFQLKHDKRAYALLGEQLKDLQGRNQLFNDTYLQQRDSYYMANELSRKMVADYDAAIALKQAQKDSIDVEKQYKMNLDAREQKALQATLAEVYAQVDALKKQGRLTEANIRKVCRETSNLTIQGIKDTKGILREDKLFPILYKQAQTHLARGQFDLGRSAVDMLQSPFNAAMQAAGVVKGMPYLFKQ